MENDRPDADHSRETARPLCREPWHNYYILRRGIMPCCHGHQAVAAMSDWQGGWNSPELQEIRSYLAKGDLSPYCLLSLSCPIVQRHLRDHPEPARVAAPSANDEPGVAQPPNRRTTLRAVNRALGGLPGRIYGRIHRGTR